MAICDPGLKATKAYVDFAFTSDLDLDSMPTDTREEREALGHSHINILDIFVAQRAATTNKMDVICGRALSSIT